MWPAVSVLVTATGLLRREGNAPLQLLGCCFDTMNASVIAEGHHPAKRFDRHLANEASDLTQIRV